MYALLLTENIYNGLPQIGRSHYFVLRIPSDFLLTLLTYFYWCKQFCPFDRWRPCKWFLSLALVFFCVAIRLVYGTGAAGE